MRVRTRGERLPCLACGKRTGFQFELTSTRGAHLRWVDMCPACGENVKVRDKALREAA